MTEAAYRLLVCCCTVSLFTVLLFGWDKWLAVKNRHRVPELALLGAALFGGGAGGLLGMLLFRHKTRKLRFRILVPLFLALQLALLVYTAFFRG